MILGFFLSILGGLGCLIFGISLLFDLFSAAQFRAESDRVPSLLKRSAKGSLKLLGLSLALFLFGLLLTTLCR